MLFETHLSYSLHYVCNITAKAVSDLHNKDSVGIFEDLFVPVLISWFLFSEQFSSQSTFMLFECMCFFLFLPPLNVSHRQGEPFPVHPSFRQICFSLHTKSLFDVIPIFVDLLDIFAVFWFSYLITRFLFVSFLHVYLFNSIILITLYYIIFYKTLFS